MLALASVITVESILFSRSVRVQKLRREDIVKFTKYRSIKMFSRKSMQQTRLLLGVRSRLPALTQMTMFNV